MQKKNSSSTSATVGRMVKLPWSKYLIKGILKKFDEKPRRMHQTT